MEGSNHVSATNNAHPDLEVLRGGVAIVTGGASGIGLALIEKSMEHGLHCVIADIEESAIERTIGELSDKADKHGVRLLGIQTDVSLTEDIDNLSEQIEGKFPGKPISLLCCNAGVGAGGSVLGARDVDWEFVLGVNLMGVVFVLGSLFQRCFSKMRRVL